MMLVEIRTKIVMSLSVMTPNARRTKAIPSMFIPFVIDENHSLTLFVFFINISKASAPLVIRHLELDSFKF